MYIIFFSNEITVYELKNEFIRVMQFFFIVIFTSYGFTMIRRRSSKRLQIRLRQNHECPTKRARFVFTNDKINVKELKNHVERFPLSPQTQKR